MNPSEEKNLGFVVGHHHQSNAQSPPSTQSDLPPPPPVPYYGTFQGVPTYPPPSNYAFQPVPGYAAVVEGRPLEQHRLPCCGFGLGWFLFVLGFFFAGIPWYVGAILFICSNGNYDYREKPGYIFCTIAAVLVTISLALQEAKRDDNWH